MTGPDLVQTIEQAARERGVSPPSIARHVEPANPSAWLDRMRFTRQPKPRTVAKVQSAIETVDQAELRRLFAREAALEAELRQVRVSIAEAGNRVSIAAGYRVMLRGENLKRLVGEGVL